MTSTSIPTIPIKLISESLGPRGLSIKQQQDIATKQSQAATMSYQQRHNNNNNNINHGKTTSLYVGELDLNVIEADLLDKFTPLGSVEKIKLCRDAITNKSLGYAYVTFSSEMDGERAVQTLNHSLIKGKPCRIMWAQKENHSIKKSSSSKLGNIFIKNLDVSITTKAIYDTFSQFGNITHCNVVLDDQGQSKGYAFVQFDSVEAAERAINNVNGMTLYNRELFVGHYIPKYERIQKSEEIKQKFTNVYVSNLVADIKDEELYELFGSYGPITSVSIKRDGRGFSRGSGYVNFDRHEDAKKVVTEMHNTEYGGKRLFVSPAQKRSDKYHHLSSSNSSNSNNNTNTTSSSTSSSTTTNTTTTNIPNTTSNYKHRGYNLYIKNLAENIDDDTLRSLFSEFGTITSAKVMRDEVSKRSKGFGFVCFTTLNEANRSIKEMDKKVIHNKEIFVAFAQKKEERRNQLEAQMSNQRNKYAHPQQQTFISIPNTSFINNGSSFYGSYPPQSNYIIQQPLQWFSTGPPIIQPNFAAGSVSFTNYPPPPPTPSSLISHQPSVPSSSSSSSSNNNNNRHTPPIHNHVIHPSTIVSPSSSPSSSSSPLKNKDNNSDPSIHSLSQSIEESNNNNNNQNDNTVITLDLISSLPIESQKQILGQRIYEAIQTKHSEIAGKVTGMLLEMEIEDLIELVNNIDLLNERAQEAANVLKQHNESNLSDSDEGN